MSISAFQRFKQEGYLIYPQIYSGDELESLKEACLHALKAYTDDHDRRSDSTDFHVIRHLNDPKWTKDHPQYFQRIMETVSDPRVLGPVEQIFRGPSLFRATSLFVTPRKESKDGDWHRDSQFGRTDEEEREILRRTQHSEYVDGLQLQIPLYDNEDIEYVPYSANRYDSPEEYYLRLADHRVHNREEGMPNAIRMKLKAGDGLIFNAYGLHRGRYHTDKPRLTLMLTYTPAITPYYDSFSMQPWCSASGYLENLSLRCKAYFQEFIGVYSDFWASKQV